MDGGLREEETGLADSLWAWSRMEPSGKKNWGKEEAQQAQPTASSDGSGVHKKETGEETLQSLALN